VDDEVPPVVAEIAVENSAPQGHREIVPGGGGPFFAVKRGHLDDDDEGRDCPAGDVAGPV
jgi:hypothetical protein